ncbi:phospholipase [Alphaproteobacteria bacterium 46_93_T64]|nr:phospholipase [Alphaproteobacteria bacterium 46_93_T64]
MKLIFVHGWSVTNTRTYGDLPAVLAAPSDQHDIDMEISHVHLGRYISFHDEVSMEDVARAFDQALRDTLATQNGSIQKFSCITHSTGGPVVREWVERFYGAELLSDLPLEHLIMLAPANHGSSLAAIGKERVSRINSWFQGVKPGQGILDWLVLGSNGQWRLNERSLNYSLAENNFFPFVLTGQDIDSKFYDFLNSYLTEVGSDGVVRVASANLNFRYVRLVQSDGIVRKRPKTLSLKVDGVIRKSEGAGFGLIPNASHAGSTMGIMNSVKLNADPQKPVIDQIFGCLKVGDKKEYDTQALALEALTTDTQSQTDRNMMMVFQIKDDRGQTIKDYDLLLLGGKRYSPGKLPEGYFIDKQMNAETGRLVYYVNAKKLQTLGAIGFRVIARPDKGFTHYAAGEFHSDEINVAELIVPNQTLYVEIEMKRRVARNVFKLGSPSAKTTEFKSEKPAKEILN